MTEPWIRVHANLHAKPVIARAVAALGVGENEAVGLMVRFWGAVSQYVIKGDLTGVTDRQIELWAGWAKRKGRFALFVRSSHLDTDGRVNEWDEYAGKLEARRALDRARKEAERVRKSRGSHAEGHAEVTHDSIPARANETIRNETGTTQSVVPAWQPIAEQRLAERLPSDAGRRALTVILGLVESKAGVVSALEAILDGMHGTATPEQLERAIVAYAAAGMSNGKFSDAHFAGFLRRAKQEPRPEPVKAADDGDAGAEFEKVRDIVSVGDPRFIDAEKLTGLPPRTRAALKTIGGHMAIKHCKPEKLVWLKKDFIAAYSAEGASAA